MFLSKIQFGVFSVFTERQRQSVLLVGEGRWRVTNLLYDAQPTRRQQLVRPQCVCLREEERAYTMDETA